MAGHHRAAVVDHRLGQDRLEPVGLLLHHELVAMSRDRTMRPVRRTSSPTFRSRMTASEMGVVMRFMAFSRVR